MGLQLDRLKQLRGKGILTDDEFETQRTRLLDEGGLSRTPRRYLLSRMSEQEQLREALTILKSLLRTVNAASGSRPICQRRERPRG